jgi:hypothetical protein
MQNSVSQNPFSRTKYLHDPDEYMQMKMRTSANFFKTAKVQTCSNVVIRNGQPMAVAFPLEKTGYKSKNSYVNTRRSAETKSHNS